MSIDSLIMFSGVFVAVIPHLGFPQSWDTVLISAAGILIVALGIVVRRRGLKSREQSRDGEALSASVFVPRHDETSQ